MGASGTTHLTMAELTQRWAGRHSMSWKENTKRTHKAILDKFANAWDSQRPRTGPKSIDDNWIEDFLTGPGGLATTDAPSSFNCRYYTLRKFTTWCTKRGYFGPGVWPDDVKLMDVDPNDKFRLTPEQMDALLDHCDPYDRWVIALLRYTAARESEVLRATVADLTIGDGEEGSTIKLLRTKASRSEGQQYYDEMAMWEDLEEEWERWERCYREHLGRPLRNTDPLIPRWLGRPRSAKNPGVTRILKADAPPATVRRIVRTHLAVMFPDVDLTGSGSHTLRRSAARELYWALDAMGEPNPIATVQAMLDHKDARTTWHYIGLDQARVNRNKTIRKYRRLRPKPGLRVVVGDASPAKEVG